MPAASIWSVNLLVRPASSVPADRCSVADVHGKPPEKIAAIPQSDDDFRNGFSGAKKAGRAGSPVITRKTFVFLVMTANCF